MVLWTLIVFKVLYLPILHVSYSPVHGYHCLILLFMMHHIFSQRQICLLTAAFVSFKHLNTAQYCLCVWYHHTFLSHAIDWWIISTSASVHTRLCSTSSLTSALPLDPLCTDPPIKVKKPCLESGQRNLGSAACCPGFL